VLLLVKLLVLKLELVKLLVLVSLSQLELDLVYRQYLMMGLELEF
jgi:hypothetical protein